MPPERATVEDFLVIVASLSDFWGDRDVRHLHHPMFIREFGDTALVMRGSERQVVAYLLGFLAPAGVGYVHVLGVHAEHRRAGLGRKLYEAFAAIISDRGAVAIKAIARPGNRGSIDFHRSLGFSASEVPDYVREGEPRIVFWRELAGD
jgi:ribosomal protein S18 acetylase RimI-like enzyme